MIPAGGAPRDERTEPTADARSGTGGGEAGGAGTGGNGTQSRPASSTTERESAASSAPRPESAPTGVLEQATRPANDSTRGLETSETPGTAVPDSGDPATARVVGGRSGKGVGAAESETEEAGKAEGATRDEAARIAEAPDEATASDDAEGPRGTNTIELPEFDIHRLEDDRTALERAGNTKATHAHPITGIWQQSSGERTSDFAPGGYERSVLMLNPATRVAAIYRVYRGSLVLVMGGELALEVAPDGPERMQDDVTRGSGSIVLRRDPSLAGAFPTRPTRLGGKPERFIDPPQPGDSFRLAWKRVGLELELDGKRYQPSTLEAFESLRRGGDDPATAEERRETAPVAPVAGGAAAGKPKEAAFFGVRGGGKRFVFIVDISGSMNGPKLDRLKQELTQSVRSLADDAEFSVVFFSGGAQTIDQGWMSARRDRDRAVQAIAAQGCDGGTDPTQAFEFAFKALSPIPDCIFFMTDGQIPPWIPDHVRTLNAARIPSVVHTIVVGTAAEEPLIRPLMEQIANENHGTYSFIPN